MNKYKKAIHLVGGILFYFVIGLFLFLFFVVLSPRLPTKNILTAFIVPTGSMQPTVPAGSIAFVTMTGAVSVGDIAAFLSPQDKTRTILHRIVGSDELGFITKGDNNQTNDNWVVPSDSVKGKLLFSIPVLGNVASFIRTKLGFFLVVFVPGAFLLAKQIMDLGSAVHAKFLPVLLFGACLFVTMSLTKVANANFADTARIKGISFAAKEVETPPPVSCNGGVDIDIEGKFPSLIHVQLNGNTLLLITLPFPQRSQLHYTMQYDHEGVSQAVVGDIEVRPFIPIIRPIFLGTCSTGGICVPHKFTTCPKIKVTVK